jgi:16S rRNA (guanine(966)-N(2))-methyltransferase RsmD
MRITGGVYRSRQIMCPKWDIRPSMDRMRVSLFSILGDLTGLSFLDLFSGSGIIGIEAASRGAEPVVLVEKDPRKRIVIGKNISFVESRIELLTMPVERFLRTNARSFDLAFLDPPFDFPGKGDILDAVAAGMHLSSEGLALIHLHRAEKLSTDREGLSLADRREYGQSIVLFFRKRGV